MEMKKVWAMPSRWTFTIKPIKELLAEEVISGQRWIDPFAGQNSPANCTNDINPESNAEYHEDALEFLRKQSDDEEFMFDGALFDPPYSPTQAKRCYDALKLKLKQSQTRKEYWARCLDELSRIIKPGGKLICFGWNSNGAGKGRGFRMDKILLVAHGGGRNDTIVTVETKLAN